MRIFVLHNEIKAGTYAETLFHFLIRFLVSREFAVKEYDDVNEASKSDVSGEKTAVILHTGKTKLSIFLPLKVQNILKKGGFNNFIYFTDSTPFPTRLPQLIIANNINKFIAKTHSSSSTFSVCAKVEKEKWIEINGDIAENLKVIPLSAEANYQPITWSEQQAIKMEYTQGREYFVMTAEGKTLRSFTELLKAFSTFKKWQHSSMKLVVAGKLSFTETDEWKEKISTYRFREDVVLLHNILSNEEIQIVAGAYAFIHTPLAENDVLPLLKSMKCEIPCISFATDSIIEYADEASIVIEQNKYDQLAEMMILIYKDEALRSRLIAKGKEVSEQYTKEIVFSAFTEALSLPLH